MDRLVTENLILRKAVVSDLNDIWHNVWCDNEIAKWMFWEVTTTEDEAIDRLNRTIKYQSERNAYFVCLKETDEVIGFAGVAKIKDGLYEDAGICIARKYQGRGYAKEVVRALIDLVFNELDGKRFLYGCFEDNEKSRRVCLALGFKYLGKKEHIRKWDQKKCIIDMYYLDKE